MNKQQNTQQPEPVNHQLLAALKGCVQALDQLDVHSIKQANAYDAAEAAIAAAEAAQPVVQCPNCLGTKRPHSFDPEWKGRCECVVQQPASAQTVAVPDAVELLRELEWQHRPYNEYWHEAAGHYCPECDAMHKDGHTSDCRLAAVLSAAQNPEGV